MAVCSCASYSALLGLAALAAAIKAGNVAAACHSPSSAMGQTAVPPTSLHRTAVSPRALFGDAQLPETRCRRKSPPQERISSAPGAQHPLSKIQRAGVRLLGGVPEAGIRARIMSISRALGAEKPTAKRPRSYMEGPCGRKLSIMSTGLPNTPSQKSKGQMLSFLGRT